MCVTIKRFLVYFFMPQISAEYVDEKRDKVREFRGLSHFCVVSPSRSLAFDWYGKQSWNETATQGQCFVELIFSVFLSSSYRFKCFLTTHTDEHRNRGVLCSWAVNTCAASSSSQANADRRSREKHITQNSRLFSFEWKVIEEWNFGKNSVTRKSSKNFQKGLERCKNQIKAWLKHADLCYPNSSHSFSFVLFMTSNHGFMTSRTNSFNHYSKKRAFPQLCGHSSIRQNTKTHDSILPQHKFWFSLHVLFVKFIVLQRLQPERSEQKRRRVGKRTQKCVFEV